MNDDTTMPTEEDEEVKDDKTPKVGGEAEGTMPAEEGAEEAEEEEGAEEEVEETEKAEVNTPEADKE